MRRAIDLTAFAVAACFGLGASLLWGGCNGCAGFRDLCTMDGDYLVSRSGVRALKTLADGADDPLLPPESAPAVLTDDALIVEWTRDGQRVRVTWPVVSVDRDDASVPK